MLSHLFHHLAMRAAAPAMAVLSAGLLAACNSAFDEQEGDCAIDYSVRFRYDHNLKFADAFANEVKSVGLYLFTPEGRFVRRYADAGAALGRQGYSMRLDGIEPGRYLAVVWGGTDGNSHFGVPPAPATLQDLQCTIARNAAEMPGWGVVDTDLNAPDLPQASTASDVGQPLFHNVASVDTLDVPAGYAAHADTIALMKNTNVVRVVLQELRSDPDPLDAQTYHVTITDDNGTMAYDNTLVAGDKLVYRPWAQTAGTADVASAQGTLPAKTLLAELTVGRLVKQGHNPMLTITRDDDNGQQVEVLSVPLIDVVLMVKGNYRKGMTDQEYLDRKDEYNLTFFLESGAWRDARIMIEGWAVHYQTAVIGEQ